MLVVPRELLRDIFLQEQKVLTVLPGIYLRTDLAIHLSLISRIVTRYMHGLKSARKTENLCEFVHFLSSVKSAMPYVQGLQALNDCFENKRIAVKLPNWLSARWNRAVTVYQYEYKMFPDYRYFVKFLNMEARIACNLITSLHAIRSNDHERSKPTERKLSKNQRS